MLDINFIRDNTDVIKEAARKKRIDVDIDRLLEVDEKRRELLQSVEGKRAEQNEINSRVSGASSSEERMFLIKDATKIKERVQEEEEKLKGIMEEWKSLMIQVPNIPDMSVPEGESEEDNVEVETWGEKPSFNFEAKDHMTLMENLGMVDFERGTKVHGFRGYFLTGAGAELSWAVWNYARDFYIQKGFVPVIAPTIVRKQYFYGTGHLPAEAEDLYETQDGDYLSGTAEVPMMAYYADEILSEKDLPKKFLAFSPCYRREAGSHGKDTKGLVRVHEFYKLEQLVLCEADHGRSVEFHKELNRNMEEFVESLGIPYRRLVISTGDLSLGKVKQYDTELWIPSQNAYREISSASYYHDYQSRRFNIRYEDSEGKKRYVHSLNGTAAPTPRLLVALVENFQTQDGSIHIPDVLKQYMGTDIISRSDVVAP